MTDSAVAKIQDSKITTAQAGQALLFNNMPEVMRGAELMASAKNMVPDHLRNNPGGCMAIIMQAQRWGMDPFAVAQKTHIVNGNLGYEAQLVNAVLKSSGSIKGRFHYEYRGEGGGLECRAGAIPAGESEVVWTEWLRLSDIKTQNSPLWKVNPRQQIAYLQSKNWARLYCPEAILGVYTPDELQAGSGEPKDITPPPEPDAGAAPRTESVKRRLLADEEDAEDAVTEPVGEEPAAQEPEPEPEEPAQDAVTFAQVAEAIRTADKLEKLAAIGNVMVPEFLGYGDNAQFKDELTDLYKARQAELKAIADEQKQ